MPIRHGRGMDVFLCGVARRWRLPHREYCAGMYFKNGVPMGYVEVMWIKNVMEVGFNLYYTFRQGETAWLYARLLKLFHQQFGEGAARGWQTAVRRGLRLQGQHLVSPPIAAEFPSPFPSPRNRMVFERRLAILARDDR